MYSFYKGKIKDLTPTKTIDFNELIDIIRTNPYKRDYNTIRTHKKGDAEYEKGKKELVRCHPNCIVKYNSISGLKFQKNYVKGSGYIYLDIDNLKNPKEYKKEFISKYKEVVSMVSISSGGNGLSVLVKINHFISSKYEYNCIIEYLKTHYFINVEFDRGSEKLSQMWFISYDPDVFVNSNVCIDVSSCLKRVNQGIIPNVVNNNILFYAHEKEIMNLSISEIESNVITKTPYKNNCNVDICEIPFTDIKIPRKISDGNKRKSYTKIIHDLFNLNKGVEPKWIFAFIYNVNRNCANPEMSYRDLLSLFNMQYKYIKSDSYCYQNNRKKGIHINPDAGFTRIEKIKISNKLNGSIRKNKTKIKIVESIQTLKNENKKCSISAISKLSGLNRKTIYNHIKDLEQIDIDLLKEEILNNIK